MGGNQVETFVISMISIYICRVLNDRPVQNGAHTIFDLIPHEFICECVYILVYNHIYTHMHIAVHMYIIFS